MRTVTYTQARQGLADLMDAVAADAEEVLVTRVGHSSVVIVSEREWTALVETDYLLRNPANAAFLRRGMAAMDAGRGEVHELRDLDAEFAGPE
jgi:antitoxin YefM